MQINPTMRYLSLLQSTLQTVMVPELSTASAKASAGVMSLILAELMKREQGAMPLLSEHIRRGEKLLCDIAQRLSIPVEMPTGTMDAEQGFSTLVRRHADLTTSLTEHAQLLLQLQTKLPLQSSLPRAAIGDLLRQVAEWECEYYRQQAALPVELPPVIPAAGAALTPAALETFLASEGESCAITRFEPLTGGFGKQTYLCEYTDVDKNTHEIVVRKTDPTPIMKFGACDLENEYALLRTLAQLDYPAPKPQYFSARWQDVDGSFYTMPRIAGTPPGSFLSGLHGEVDERILLELAELLARLHRIPFETFGDYIRRYDDPRILEGSIEDCYRYNLEGWKRYIDSESHLQSPYLIWLLDWLFNHIPGDSRRPILIHGDFNIHNVLANDGHITAVLDWECAGFGAPEQDLAYIQPHVSKYIDWQKFVDHYQAHGGYAINPQVMAFGMVYSALRTNLAGNRATQNLQSGANSDIRYAMVELGFTQSFMELALSSAAP